MDELPFNHRHMSSWPLNVRPDSKLIFLHRSSSAEVLWNSRGRCFTCMIDIHNIMILFFHLKIIIIGHPDNQDHCDDHDQMWFGDQAVSSGGDQDTVPAGIPYAPPPLFHASPDHRHRHHHRIVSMSLQLLYMWYITENIDPIWSWRLLTEGFEKIAPLSSE